MHLVIPTHPYFFLAVCHPSRTFPPKKPEQEPQNRFSPLPTAKPCPLLPLTMTHHFLYWLGTGWWCLGLARAPLLCMSKTCPLPMRWPRSGGLSAHSAAHSWLLMTWAIFWFPILYDLLPLAAGLCLIMGFSSFNLLFCSFLQSCYHFLLYHSTILAMILFDPSLLGLFGPIAYSSLNNSVWSLGSFIILLAGSCVPFISSWASLTYLLFLGILSPFSNSAFPWAFTNSFRLPQPNYLILHP